MRHYKVSKGSYGVGTSAFIAGTVLIQANNDEEGPAYAQARIQLTLEEAATFRNRLDAAIEEARAKLDAEGKQDER